MRKIFYSLAVLVAVGSLSMQAQDNDAAVNLLEGCFSGYANNAYPNTVQKDGYSWNCYTATGVERQWLPDGTYGARVQTNQNIGGTNMDILLTRWDSGGYDKFFTVKVHLEGDYKYNFSCIAGNWNNHSSGQLSDAGLYTEGKHGIRVSINNQPGIVDGEMAYVVTPLDEASSIGAGAARYAATMKTISLSYTAQEDGDYYISFVGCHGIFPIANLVLTQGEAIDYEVEFNTLKETVTTFLTDNEIELGSSGEREEDLALDAALNPTAEEGGNIDYKTAYKALNNAFITFKNDLPSYEALDQLQDQAVTYVEMYPYASDETQAAFAQAAFARPTTVADAETALTTLTNAWRAVAESNAIAEGFEGVTTVTLPADFTTSLGTLSGEPPTKADGSTIAPYKDGGNGGEATMKVTLGVGMYRYALYARASANATSTINATAENPDAIISVEQNLTAAGNSGNVFGRGWNIDTYDFQVKEDDTEVTITINATGGWFSFVSPTLVKLGDGIDYEGLFNTLKNEISTFLEEEEVELGGKGEREEDIALDAALNPTAEADGEIDYSQALVDLNAAYETFKTALPAYKELEALQTEAKKFVDSYDDASEETAAAFSQACYVNPTSAAAAGEAITTLTNAWRAVVESQAKVAGKEGVEQTLSAWTTTIGKRTTEAQPATLANGDELSDYYDEWNKGAKTATTTAILSKGSYRFSIFARASSGINTFTLTVSYPNAEENVTRAGEDYEKTMELTHDNASGNIFGNGWNLDMIDFEVPADDTTVTFTVNADSSNSNWYSFMNPSLYSIPTGVDTAVTEVEAAADVEAAYYTIDGVKVNGKLAKGLYIKVAGSKTSKVLVK